MNQGKLEVVKLEMARVNVDILGISELKWTGMGEFNSDDHHIYCYGQESLKGHGVAIVVNKRVQNAVFGCNLKNDRMVSVCLQGKPFNITVIQAYAPTSNTKEAEVEQKTIISSVQFSSVPQSCQTLCDPLNLSTPGLPIHHQLPELLL